jgi:hypothetical protein
MSNRDEGSFTNGSILTIENHTLAYDASKTPSRYGGLPYSFRKIMQGVSEESITNLQTKLKLDVMDCDLYTWNFKGWGYNVKVRQTPRNLRLNPR